MPQGQGSLTRIFCSTGPYAMAVRALDSPDLVASIKNLKQCCLIRQYFFTATWSELVHDQKKSSQNVQKLDFENFIQNPSFSWAQFSLRLFCSTRPNAMGIRALDSPDLGASIKNLKQYSGELSVLLIHIQDDFDIIQSEKWGKKIGKFRTPPNAPHCPARHQAAF